MADGFSVRVGEMDTGLPLGVAPQQSDSRKRSRSGPPPGDSRALWARKQMDDAKPTIEKWRKQAAECDRFDAGKHFSEADIREMDLEGRPHAVFNASQKWIRFVVGLMRQSMPEIQALPRNPSNDKELMESDVATKTVQWVSQNCNADQERAAAFKHLVRRGMGWTDTQFDRSIDVSGLINVVCVDGHEMYWDVRARRPCMPDMRWVARERKASRREASLRFPGHVATIIANASLPTGSAVSPYNTSTLISEKNAIPQEGRTDVPLGKPNEVTLTEFQWYEEVPGIYFFDPLTGKDDWLSEEAFKKFEARYERIAPRLRQRAGDLEVPLQDQERELLLHLPDEIESDRVLMKEYQRMIMVGTTVVWGPHPLLGKRFTFNCMTGQWDDEDGIWTGFYKLLMDPQRYMTKYANQVQEIIARTAKGGATVEIDAVENPAEFEAKHSKTGSIDWVKAGRIGSVKEKDQPQLPAASIEMFTVCKQMLIDVTGIDPASSMGATATDQAAMTMRQRQAAARLLLSEEFDVLDQYLIYETYTILDFIPLIADDRLVRVGDPYNFEVIQLIKDPFQREYDIVLDTSMRDPNVRDQYWASVEKMAGILIKANMFVPEMLDYAPWPASWKFALKQKMKQQVAQAQKMAQQGLSIGGRGKPTSIQELQARVNELKAKAALESAKAVQLTEGVKNQRAKILLDGMIKQAELQQDDKHTQQQGASGEAMGLLGMLQQAGKPPQGGGEAG